MLSFTKGNAKLDKSIYILSLPAGYSCPGALKCKSQAVPTKDGLRIKDGKYTEFRCYAATQEVLFVKTYEARARNYAALKGLTKREMVDVIGKSLPKKAKLIRLHASGDFFSQRYFDAWIKVARKNPNRTFYAYTKSLKYWCNRLNDIPANLVLTASFGGKHDTLIPLYKLRYARVVFSEEDAKNLGLPIDHDDSHAIAPKGNFALLLHGVQPKGTESSKALSKLKKKGKGGYSKKKLPVSTT